MGEVISLDQRRRGRTGSAEACRGARPGAEHVFTAATLWFDLGSPGTYFAAERADRLFPALAWRPVLAPARLAQGALPARMHDTA
ncbi:MAG: hypothetical protein JWO90_925, partial [Solirubrobacterales bacterium]|nr:hypothetical protein [Solirubrobacterales bacterium]